MLHSLHTHAPRLHTVARVEVLRGLQSEVSGERGGAHELLHCLFAHTLALQDGKRPRPHAPGRRDRAAKRLACGDAHGRDTHCGPQQVVRDVRAGGKVWCLLHTRGEFERC